MGMAFVYRRDYPKNPRWRAFTRQQLKLRPVCEECLAHKSSELHHRYYYVGGVSILGRETPHDVTAICRPCHVDLHQQLWKLRRETGEKRGKPWWRALF